MRKLAIILVLALCGCEPDNPWTGTVQLDEPWTGTVQLDAPFDLPFRGIATIEGDGLTITFSGDVVDSRCPTNMKCQLIGAVTIKLEIETESQGLATIVLSSAWFYPYNPASIDTLGYRISLIGIEPGRGQKSNSIPTEDYVAKLEVMAPWLEGSINLFDADSYSNYLGRSISATSRDTMWVDGDRLVVPVQHSGGCNEHDFYLFGTCPTDAAGSANLTISLLHDGHGDACDAWLADTLKFDLDPLRTCGLAADSVALSFINDSSTVMFGL